MPISVLNILPYSGFTFNPGCSFVIERQCTVNKQDLKQALSGIDRANVAVRNFPLSAEALRKKLKLKDGGDHYLFGTTQSDGTHVLFICRKTPL